MAESVIPTTCPLDCPDTCALEVRVRDGRIERIAGGGDHPVTDGFICTKVARFAQRVYHPERLTTPLRRVGPKGTGEFAPIDWEEAIAEITGRIRAIKKKWGGEAILPYHYGGSNGYLSDGLLDHLYFARLGASRLLRTLCAGPTTAVATGMYGKMPGVAFEDFVHAKCIVIWGANPKASNIHLIPFVREAKQRGAFVAVVDPVRNLTVREADLHLPVLPGTDLPVALSMIRLWREQECLDDGFLAQHVVGLEELVEAAEKWPLERAAAEAGVPAADIERLARVYADAAPAVIRCGWGLERNSNGGHAVAAILAMPALLGKFGERGGGYTLSNSGAGKFDRDAVLGPVEWTAREINMTPLGEVLTSPLVPPIEALFVYNCNPVATVPDQHAVLRGLEREDLFTVVFDQIMTDTVPYADVVLPATTFLEHYDLRMAYGSYVVGGVQPVVPPPGDAKSNHEVFALLGQAMGFEDEAFGWDEQTALQRTAEALSLGRRKVDGGVARGGVARFDFPGATPVMFETVLPRTADGKVHLAPGELGSRPYAYRPPDATYPLALISPATSKTVSSTMGEYNLRALYAELHPDDAAPRKIGDGDPVRVHNELGEVVCLARVRDRVRPGVVSIPKGAWRRASLSGFTSTALCPAHVNDVGGGACYNDARPTSPRDRGCDRCVPGRPAGEPASPR
jgi:anaerobic selenocysteine-containing dehydrogenase